MADVLVDDGEAAVIKALERFCSAASDMLLPFTKRLDELAKWSLEIDRAGRVAKGVTLDVCMVLQNLRVFLCSVKGKGTQYVRAVRDTAIFVCESGIIEEVKKDLENQSTENLLDFVVDMEKYLNKCEVRLRDFEAIEEAFKRDVTQKLECWECKRKEAEEKEASYCRWSGGMAIAGECLAHLAPAVAKTNIAPRITVMVGGVAASFIAKSLAAVFAVEKGVNEQQKKVYEEALCQAMVFNNTRADVFDKVQTMKQSMETVKGNVEGNDGDFTGLVLKHEANSPTYKEKRGCRVLREYHRIDTSLKSLQSCMKELLEQANEYIQSE